MGFRNAVKGLNSEGAPQTIAALKSSGATVYGTDQGGERTVTQVIEVR
jgi:hypothetical protein